MNVLFICTGNTCRSPMAEALLKHKHPEFNVKSAGIFAFHQSPAAEQAIEVMKERSVSIDHQSQQVNEKLIQWADLILTMTENHKQQLYGMYPNYTEKIYTLTEYTNDSSAQVRNIGDPFGGDIALYRKTALEIEEEIDRFIEKIKEKRG